MTSTVHFDELTYIRNTKFVTNFIRTPKRCVYIYLIRRIENITVQSETVSLTGDCELIYEQQFGQKRMESRALQRGGIHLSPKGCISKRELICPRRAKTHDNCARD